MGLLSQTKLFRRNLKPKKPVLQRSSTPPALSRVSSNSSIEVIIGRAYYPKSQLEDIPGAPLMHTVALPSVASVPSAVLGTVEQVRSPTILDADGRPNPSITLDAVGLSKRPRGPSVTLASAANRNEGGFDRDRMTKISSTRPQPSPPPLSRDSSFDSMKAQAGGKVQVSRRTAPRTSSTELKHRLSKGNHRPPTLNAYTMVGSTPTPPLFISGTGEPSPLGLAASQTIYDYDERKTWGSERYGAGRPERPTHVRFAPGGGVVIEDESEKGSLCDQTNTASQNQPEKISSLESLMANHTPSDLSGQVSIPDHRSPAQGGLADVHTGRWNGKKVAVKILRIRKCQKADADSEASNERRIRREIHVWSALKHPNIAVFLGYSTDFSDYPSMISMWYERGTAWEYLDHQHPPVNERIRLDVCEGLAFLHRLKVVHGDLKPSNVLVDDDCVARLCDFGLVRLVDWEGPAGMTTTSPYTGTERYKAPELFISTDNRHPVATFEGDIYSLGCLMLEFIEQVHPFKRFRRGHALRNAIMDGEPPALRSETANSLSSRTENLWDLLEACWDEAPHRPIVRVIVDNLNDLATVR